MSGSVVHFARVLLFSYGINAGNLQQIIIKIFSLVYLNFGKLQSNTFTEKIPKISTDLENELNYQLAHCECERAMQDLDLHPLISPSIYSRGLPRALSKDNQGEGGTRSLLETRHKVQQRR